MIEAYLLSMLLLFKKPKSTPSPSKTNKQKRAQQNKHEKYPPEKSGEEVGRN